MLAYLDNKSEFRSQLKTLSKYLPTVQWYTQIIKFWIKNKFYSWILHTADLATYSIKNKEFLKEKSNGTLVNDISYLLEVLISNPNLNEQWKPKSKNNNEISFLLDIENYLMWDKNYWDSLKKEPTLDCLNHLQRPMENIKNVFTFEEIWDLIYYPVKPDSPYEIIEKLLKICKQLYDAALHAQNIQADSNNWFFKFCISSLSGIYEKIDPNSNWSKQNNGSLNQQYQCQRAEYKIDKSEYKNTKETIQKVSDEILKFESGKVLTNFYLW